MKCKKCGSENIIVYIEKVYSYKYKLKKNGEMYKKPFEINYADTNSTGHECTDCGYFTYSQI